MVLENVFRFIADIENYNEGIIFIIFLSGFIYVFFLSSIVRAIMAKIDLSVIDRMFSAQLSANESEETIKALRPKAEKAVKKLIKQKGLPSNFTGTIDYNAIRIVVRRPTSYTWEQNNQIKDPALDYYKSLHAMSEQLNNDLKKRRAEMKGVAKSLELAYPNSKSVKSGFTIALMTA